MPHLAYYDHRHRALREGHEVAGGLLLLVIGAVLGMALDQIFTAYSRRPKIRCVGFGSGGSELAAYATVENVPGLIGFMLRPLRVFRWQITTEYKPIGFAVERTTAKGRHAFLVERSSGKTVTLLFWRSIETNEVLMNQHVAINDSERLLLLVFAQNPATPSRYYPWELDQSTGASPTGPRIPHPIYFDEPGQFDVVVRSNRGATLMRFGVDVEREFDRRLTFRMRTR